MKNRPGRPSTTESIYYKFHNHPNPFQLKYKTVLSRVRIKGMSFEEAMSIKKLGWLEVWRNHPNPLEIRYKTFCYRVSQLGMSVEDAMSVISLKKRPIDPTSICSMFHAHSNPKKLQLATIYRRVKTGMTFEEAMKLKSYGRKK